MDKTTKRLMTDLIMKSDQIEVALPTAMLGQSHEFRILCELLHEQVMLTRCLLAHLIRGSDCDDVPNGENFKYSKLQPPNKNV